MEGSVLGNNTVKDNLLGTLRQMGEITTNVLLTGKDLSVEYLRGEIGQLHLLHHKLREEILRIDGDVIPKTSPVDSVGIPGTNPEGEVPTYEPAVRSEAQLEWCPECNGPILTTPHNCQADRGVRS